MREQPGSIAGEPIMIRTVENSDDIHAFCMWLIAAGPVLAADTETTGLDVFAPGFRCRRVQVGDRRDAWVFDAELHREVISLALARRTLVFHNRPFDLLVLERAGLLDLQDGLDRSIDTRNLSHLIDPRDRKDGGIGQALKDLCAHHVDRSAKDSEKELKAIFAANKWKIAEGYARIDLMHPTYTYYAGYDVILAFRLYEVLSRMVIERGHAALVGFEHRIQAVTTRMSHRGMCLDVAYTERLSAELLAESQHHAGVAAELGLANVNSPKQVVAALQAEGWTHTTTTKSGAPQADASALEAWNSPLAQAILASKRAGKRRSSYAENMLSGRDESDRVHAVISSLQARTARMSISNPPLQQLPSREWKIRRALLFDPGYSGISCDYSAVEMRVLAALGDIPRMREAIHAGRDLHDFTAEIVYGPSFTDAQRKLCKGVGFGKVYGGGADTLAKQTGAPLDKVRKAIKAYDTVYPEIRRYSARLMRLAENDGHVVTPFGRRLPVDDDRLYAATNYVIQSTARDLLGRALIRLEQRGLDEYLLLPIHDEVLAQAPAEQAEEISAEIADAMREADFYGVPIDTDAALALHGSWGSLPDYDKYRPEGEIAA